MDSRQLGNLLCFGGETSGIPFLSIHNMNDPEFNMFGSNIQVLREIENRLKEQKKNNQLTDSEYTEKRKEYQEYKDNLLVSFKSFPNFSKCIFNVEFLRCKRKIVVATDFRQNIAIIELIDNNTLNSLFTYRLHTGRRFSSRHHSGSDDL